MHLLNSDKSICKASPMRRSALFALASILFMPLACLASDMGTGKARFSWQGVAEPTVSGYKVYWGTESGVYTHTQDAGNMTEVVITAFSQGVRYFAAVTAYSATGEESDYSAEIPFIYITDPDEDPDGDGMVNLLELALKGGDPNVGNCGILPRLSVIPAGMLGNSNYLALVVDKNPAATGIDCIVEVSGDLVNWQTGSGYTVVVSDTPETLVVRDSIPMNGSTKRFLRLRVTVGQP